MRQDGVRCEVDSVVGDVAADLIQVLLGKRQFGELDIDPVGKGLHGAREDVDDFSDTVDQSRQDHPHQTCDRDEQNRCRNDCAYDLGHGQIVLEFVFSLVDQAVGS